MSDDPSQLPPGHRVFRFVVLAVLAGTAFVALRSGPAAAGVRAVLHTDARITAAIWHPLRDGGGWLSPVLPRVRPEPVPPHPAGSASPSTSTRPGTVKPAASPGPSPRTGR